MTPVVWGSQCAQPISPPVGEMPGRAEGGITAPPWLFRQREAAGNGGLAAKPLRPVYGGPKDGSRPVARPRRWRQPDEGRPSAQTRKQRRAETSSAA
ncbi:hypothetical protein ELI56_04100 [Rhizobium ruizarguesonis]|nr:hypothetical protein ELI56_04100 [Rhizobium ruizarguesonis]TBB31182.1 hypothetical protein ELH47_04160 [Rhizobium ruizarguesonis]